MQTDAMVLRAQCAPNYDAILWTPVLFDFKEMCFTMAHFTLWSGTVYFNVCSFMSEFIDLGHDLQTKSDCLKQVVFTYFAQHYINGLGCSQKQTIRKFTFLKVGHC